MMRRNVLFGLFTIMLMIPIALLGLLSSETGSRWLVQGAFSILPGQVSVKSMEGRLIDRIRLTDMQYQSDSESIAINHLLFAWQAKKLFLGTLKIVDVTVQGINISLAETAEQPEQTPVELPSEIPLPLQLIIDNFLLTDLQLHIGKQLHTLESLRLSAATEAGQLSINLHELNAKPLAASAQAKLGLGKGFPLSVTADWQLDAKENGLWRGATTVNGDLAKLSFDNQLSSPFDLVFKGDIKNVLKSPYLIARGDWRNLKWPITGSAPEFQSRQGSIEVIGLLDDYRITLTGRLAQSDMPESNLSFNGKGRQDAMAIENLALTSTAGSFQLTGDISWQDAPAFDLTLTGKNFNPAVAVPEIPGSLTFKSHVQGRMAGNALQLDGEINQLTGTLRGYAVAANGKARLNGDQLEIDAFRIASGANKLAVDGTLGQQRSALEFVVDAPNLNQLWPGLGGRLHGQGHIRGAWKNPVVKLKAHGSQLRFAEHSAEELALSIDYDPGAKKASELRLTSRAMTSGTLQLSKLLIEGMGTPDQHTLKMAVNSSVGDLSAALSGSVQAETWRGSFSRLNLTSPDGGRWQLAKNLDIRIKRNPEGIDALINESCLIRQAAFLCAQGHYLADGDFNAKLKASELPLSVVQSYLPEKMTLNGRINGDADVQRQDRVLAGRYRLDMPAGTTIHLQTGQGKQDFIFGASSVSGKINRDLLSADLNMALLGRDYLRGKLQMNTGKSQALSGQLAASLVEFKWLKSMVPQLTDFKGDLQADLTLKGTVVKPEAHGVVRFTEGAAEIAGHTVDQINFEAVAGEKSDRITMHGTAKSGGGSARVDGEFFFDGDYQFTLNAPALPMSLLQTHLPEHITLKGVINADAEIRQRTGLLTGRYRIEVPAGARVIVNTPKTATKIPLGASLLTGKINGELISTDIDLGLSGKDFIRGQLHLDTGKARSMDGHMTASLVEFAPLDSFVPQVSGIKGSLHADIFLKGTIDQPVANGSLRLANAAADIVDLGLGLRELNLQALAAGDNSHRIQIQGSAQSGTGVVKLDGFVVQKSGWPIDLQLSGEDFEVAKLPEAQIAVSPALKLTFAGTQFNVTGKLKVPKAIIQLKELPENSVNVSADEIIQGQEQYKSVPIAATNIGANIDVELGKNVSFTGLGLKTHLAGRLRIKQAGGKLAMQGNVDMSKATYKRYGQDLTVRKGRFIFNGPVDNPWLDVEAIRISKNNKVTAILALSGPVKAPKTSISSEPALPEAEALAYLITGRALNQVSQSEGNMIASAALSYGAGQLSWIAGKLGVDEFEVKEGDTLQDTLLSVGQYLNPDFYVGTKLGLFNKQASLVLKHKLTESVNVETEAGESQRIKMNYEFDSD